MSENTATIDAPEAAEAVELTEQEQAEQAAEQERLEALVEEFQNVAKTVAADADHETGSLAPAQLQPVKEAYRDIEGGAKFKNKAKNFIADQMKDALSPETDTPITQAVAWNLINGAVLETTPRASSGGGAAKPTVSQEKVFADRVQALRLAVDLAEGPLVPEGLGDWASEISDDDTIDAAKAYLDWSQADPETRGDEPEVSIVVKHAVKIATGKGPRKPGRPAGQPFQGTRRDVAAHILNAFNGLESGTFLTVSEIKNTKSEEYGEDSPSAGAISARLFPKDSKGNPTNCTVDGIQPGENAQGVKGAYKA